jgi:hypothetical protein
MIFLLDEEVRDTELVDRWSAGARTQVRDENAKIS